ncbi:hypothetical protein NKJ06_21150 [Mesorhizobium sp. M0293]|uniref:hypothetical protein n=1 Tax=Mesorhizobium sp. M0293 TaxID=2956930 RepID=UPI00333568B9
MREFVGTMPARIEALPRDHRGFPVPWFVAWQDGKPLFPVLDPEKMRQALRHEKCWVCGQRLGAYKAFVIGPMCCVNRVTAEPPCHLECAQFAVLNCPFMASPLTKRTTTDDGTYKGQPIDKPAGMMIDRNPGVSCIWITKSFQIENHGGKPLWRIGPPHKVSFWARSRVATRAEVEHSVVTGLPILRKVAALDGPAGMKALDRQIGTFWELVDEVELPDIDLPGLMQEAVP